MVVEVVMKAWFVEVEEVVQILGEEVAILSYPDLNLHDVPIKNEVCGHYG